MERVIERNNMTQALKRLEQNKGSAVVDYMPVEDLRARFKDQWSKVKGQLLSGSYRPQPVRRVEKIQSRVEVECESLAFQRS